MLYFKKWLYEIISFFHSTLCFTYQCLTTLQLKTNGKQKVFLGLLCSACLALLQLVKVALGLLCFFFSCCSVVCFFFVGGNCQYNSLT